MRLACYHIVRRERLSIKCNPLGHFAAVDITQMPVSLGNQYATIHMAEPTSDYLEINTRFDAVGTKEMAHGVVRVMRVDSEFAAGVDDAGHRGFDLKNPVGGVGGCWKFGLEG